MRFVPFMDVCDIQGGTQPPKSEWISSPKDGYVRMLQIRDFTQPKNPKIEYVKNKSSLKKCENGDILIARYGASIGRILTGLSGAYNVAMAKCIYDDGDIEKRYLYHWLNSDNFQNAVAGFGGRAAQAGFNKRDLSHLEFPLPPLAEQKRIAKILDAAEVLRAKRRESLAQLDVLLQSTFFDLFGDPIANPMGWRKDALSECSDSIQIGPFGSLLHKEDYVKHGVPLINPKHIVKGLIAPGDDERVSEGKCSCPR
ncbi:restriction endonuclease subunit S [Marinobacter sp.]|uniref:restriction endonuclease subunit S n=1 Tax=Marinobacter sp. TaxID=50741 RepID=UPI001995D7D9|nr:restriction endonuclease subunit S [Marinobacter sp.]MBC7193972.1 restriction endonuclease subunit S [Marinobacter sp.]